MKAPVWILIVSLALLIGYGIYQAGINEIGAPSSGTPAEISGGKAMGHRLSFLSWSIEYDRIRASADGTIVDVDGVKNGVFYRAGKPYLKLKATHLTVNTVSKDFTADGPLTIESLESDHRSFTTTAAVWTNATQQLAMNQRIVVKSPDGAVLHLDTLTMNVKTGEVHVGNVAGDVTL